MTLGTFDHLHAPRTKIKRTPDSVSVPERGGGRGTQEAELRRRKKARIMLLRTSKWDQAERTSRTLGKRRPETAPHAGGGPEVDTSRGRNVENGRKCPGRPTQTAKHSVNPWAKFCL